MIKFKKIIVLVLLLFIATENTSYASWWDDAVDAVSSWIENLFSDPDSSQDSNETVNINNILSKYCIPSEEASNTFSCSSDKIANYKSSTGCQCQTSGKFWNTSKRICQDPVCPDDATPIIIRENESCPEGYDKVAVPFGTCPEGYDKVEISE